MVWVRETETVLKGGSKKCPGGMKKWALKYKTDLHKLILKIRGSLDKLVRLVIVALITTDVHARDIIEELHERNVISTHDFLWQQQLRYHWNVDADDCVIYHSDAKVCYYYIDFLCIIVIIILTFYIVLSTTSLHYSIPKHIP